MREKHRGRFTVRRTPRPGGVAHRGRFVHPHPEPNGGDGYRVAEMEQHHLPEVMELLGNAMPGSLLVALGQGFLRELLSSYISNEGGCSYVSLHDGRVVGLVVGTENSGLHRQLLLRRQWAALLGNTVWGAVLSPRVMGRLSRYLLSYLPLLWPSRLRPSRPGRAESLPPASLVLLAVDLTHRRHGIAAELTSAFVDEMARRGVRALKAVVGGTNEAALSFFLSGGWRVAENCRTSEKGTAYRLVRETDSRISPRRRSIAAGEPEPRGTAGSWGGDSRRLDGESRP